MDSQLSQYTGHVCLAPMAGFTDSAFRRIAKTHGASLVFSELISADGLVRDSVQSYKLATFHSKERPVGIQIFGSEPDVMARAAALIEKLSPDFIDLNFGCPAKKVVRRGAGAAILKDLHKMRRIVRAVVASTSIPVSCKIRSGWDKSKVVAVDAAQICEEEGAAFVTLHARTKADGFSGLASLDLIREVKQAVKIPVIGNGDIRSPHDVRRMLDETGCDSVMIGRGALGRPWIFQQINHFMETGEQLPDPPYNQRINACIAHYRLAIEEANEERTVREMRKQVGWYLKGMPGCSQIRQRIMWMDTADEVISCLTSYAARLSDPEIEQLDSDQTHSLNWET